MRRAALLLSFVTACHGAESKPAVAPVVLPDPEPAPVVRHEAKEAHFVMMIDFALLRAHPAAAKLAVLVPLLPVWRQMLTGSKLDVMRDGDWMSIEGANVHDVGDDVALLHYSASDADVESAIVTLGAKEEVDLGEPGVRAWKIDLHGDRVFLRPKNDHVVAMMPLDQAKAWAHTLGTTVVRPGPHGDHAVDIRATSPHELVPLMPGAFFVERIWIAGVGEGAKLRLEGDCADEPSARAAAAELEEGVKKRNTLAVKLVTHGAFNAFRAEPKGPMVVADVPFSPEQVDAVLQMTAVAQGAKLPP